MFSIASSSSYGQVINTGSTDPFDYGAIAPIPSLGEHPSSDEFPAPGLQNQPSVASLVWSYVRFAARYEAMISSRRIIFFRNDLSEDEYVGVGKEEIEDIKGEGVQRR
jgi:hypothetical protein